MGPFEFRAADVDLVAAVVTDAPLLPFRSGAAIRAALSPSHARPRARDRRRRVRRARDGLRLVLQVGRQATVSFALLCLR